MIVAYLPSLIVALIVGVLGLRWAKQEREESRERRRRLKY